MELSVRNTEQAGVSTPRRLGPVFADVLCAVDGSRGGSAAVAQASALAAPTGSVTLLAVTAVSGMGQYRTAAISPARVDRVLSRAAQLAQAEGVRTARLIDPGSPPDQIIIAESARHQMLAMGAPALSPLGGSLVGSVAHSALDALRVPLLAARPMPRGVSFDGHVIVASDATDASRYVVEVGCRIARARGAIPVLVHAPGEEWKSRPHRIEAQARELEYAAGTCELLEDPADPRTVIEGAARQTHASLIVMGSRRLGGLRALGSVSRHVVGQAPCSVLVVPPVEDGST